MVKLEFRSIKSIHTHSSGATVMTEDGDCLELAPAEYSALLLHGYDYIDITIERSPEDEED